MASMTGAMDPGDRERINKNWQYLLDNIDAQYLMDRFVEKRIFSIDDTSEINHEASTTNKNRMFLDKLCRSNRPGAYSIFKDVLKETGYDFVVRQLDDTPVNMDVGSERVLCDLLSDVPDEVKSHCLESKDLLPFAKSFGNHRKLVVSCLDIKPVQFEQIQLSNPHDSATSHHITLLGKWRSARKANEATLQCLIESFQEAYDIEPDTFDLDFLKKGINNIIRKYPPSMRAESS